MIQLCHSCRPRCLCSVSGSSHHRKPSRKSDKIQASLMYTLSAYMRASPEQILELRRRNKLLPNIVMYGPRIYFFSNCQPSRKCCNSKGSWALAAMSTVPISQHVRGNGQPAAYISPEQQENFDVVREGIMNAVNALYFGVAVSTDADSTELAYHFSRTISPIFRHVCLEDAGTPLGWVHGLTGVRSYFDLLNLHWTRHIRVRQSTIKIDPVNRTCQFVVDIEWTWHRPGMPGWSEVLQCNHTYDWDYKLTIGEYITLSGRDTCWLFMARAIGAERRVRVIHWNH